MKLPEIIFTVLAVVLSFVISSCDKDETVIAKGAYSNGVFIVNEGPFQTGTGTITFYSADSNSTRQDIFGTVNGRPLGNIVQSMSVYNGRAYIVVNNADKVEVVDIKSFRSAGTITGLKNPAQFLGINDNKAYISNWNGLISLVDLASNTVIKTLSAGTGPDAMIQSGKYVFIANTGGFGIDSTITVVDYLTDKIVKTIAVGKAPSGLVRDGSGKVWVLSRGKGFDGWPQPGDTPGKLQRIDPATLVVDYTYEFPSSQVHPDRLVINSQKTILYFLYNNGIYRYNFTLQNAIPERVVARSFYSLGYEEKTGYLYAADPKDYISDGIVVRINPVSGITVDSIPAGLIPRAFVFSE